MKKVMFVLVMLISFSATAQNGKTSDFFSQIKSYDLSTLLNTDSILTEDRENSKEKIKRPEILGFIGDDYQRLQIHFISIIQNPANPYQYLAYGKTKVKGIICSFQGTITVKSAEIYKIGEIPKYKQGFAACDVLLYEDKKQASTGFIKGKLNSNFIIDDKGTFRYDAFMLVADGFSNNDFVGTWTSYKTGASKKCNWGDYRIPESKKLDIGAGEFSVDEKYIKNGWETYKLAWGTNPETPEVKRARQQEWQWWK